MATEIPQGANPLAGIASLLQTLGGTKDKTTTSAGDTAALQSVLQQLQGQDYTQLLQGIFQQAAGNIPGLQSAYANATGARSGGNSAVQAALSSLLQQTTLAAQDNIARQKAQNLATQTQAANAIAQATRGTSTAKTSGTNMGQAAKLIAGLQLMGKLRGMANDEEGLGGMLNKLTGGRTSGVTTSPVVGATASGVDLPAFDSEMPDLFQPAELPANFDQPLNLDELFGGMDLGGIDLESSLDFTGLGDNSDLGEWSDPMLDPNIDWSL